MREEVLKLVCEKDPNSFKAIGELRENLKDHDPFFIYKINDGTFNDEVSYVFKSSRSAAELVWKWTVMIWRIRVVYMMNQYTVILCIPELTTTKMLQLE